MMLKPSQPSLSRQFREWRYKRRIARNRHKVFPESGASRAGEGPLATPGRRPHRRRIERPKLQPMFDWQHVQRRESGIARARRRAAEAVDSRIALAVMACVAVAAVGAGGYVIGESSAVGAEEAADARQASFEEAFAAARQEAIAQGQARGREAGKRVGQRAAERLGARVGARRGAAAAAQELARIEAAEAAEAAAAERAAERRAARQEPPADEAAAAAAEPEPTFSEPTPEPAPPPPTPEPCFDVTGHPC
jgi:hypothetical protein